MGYFTSVAHNAARLTGTTVRGEFARLNQIASLLNLERVSEHSIFFPLSCKKEREREREREEFSFFLSLLSAFSSLSLSLSVCVRVLSLSLSLCVCVCVCVWLSWLTGKEHFEREPQTPHSLYATHKACLSLCVCVWLTHSTPLHSIPITFSRLLYHFSLSLISDLSLCVCSQVNEVMDYWDENSRLQLRLTPGEVRKVLSRRVEFRPEEIAQLKL